MYFRDGTRLQEKYELFVLSFNLIDNVLQKKEKYEFMSPFLGMALQQPQEPYYPVPPVYICDVLLLNKTFSDAWGASIHSNKAARKTSLHAPPPP